MSQHGFDEAWYQRHLAKLKVSGPPRYAPDDPKPSMRVPSKRKQPSQAILFQCKALGLPEPVAEFRFHETRRFAFDWAWPDLKVALEQEGVVYPTEKGDHRLGGRHVSVSGFTRDTVKYGEAFKLGWRVLRCLPKQIEDGTAVNWLEPILRGKSDRATP